ncbi:MAG: PAS domain S-box protein [Candidatus Thorarchaeota archaeon]|nr:PAS domain S-box protein [Candidatus Thorarchaeota archaeon]
MKTRSALSTDKLEETGTMGQNESIPSGLPDTERKDFMVLETHEQKESLYHPIRLEILRALDQGVEDFQTEVKTTEKQMDDGTVITEEVTTRTPSRRLWMSVAEVLDTIKENKPKLKISNYNCYYHLRKLREEGLVEQYPPPKKGEKGSSKRVRGMYFRTTAKFFVPTTFEISPDLTERDVLPPEITEKAVELAQQVKETGRADAYEYQLKIGRSTYWFSVTMSLHDDGESIVSVVRDITAQKSTEEELRKSRERLELALRGADLAPWDWQHTTGRMVFSDRIAEMLGYTPEELNAFAYDWMKLIHPDDFGLVESRWDEHLKNKTPMFSSEHRLVTKSGRFVWVLDRGRVVERDEDGTPLRSAGTLLDVTHEKLMLEALDRSEERYRRLFEESLQGIVIFVDGKIVFANEAYAETVGRTIGELLAMSAEETWTLVHPDDRKELEMRNKLVASGAEKLPKQRFRYIRPDGEIRWVDSYVNVVEHDGQRAMQALEVDITEQHMVEIALQESEKRFRGVFEHTPIGIVLYDTNGRIIQFNETARLMFGVSGPSDYESYRLDRDQNVPQGLLESIQRGEVVKSEIRYDLAKGGFRSSKSGTIDVQVISSALREEDGTVSLYITQVMDVTENQRFLKTLKEDKEKYRLLFNAAEEAVLVFKDEQVVDCSTAAFKFFNCEKEQLLGKTLWQLSPRNQVDKQSSKEKSQQLMSKVTSGKQQDLRWDIKTFDGERLEIQLKLSHFTVDEESYVRASIKRVTERG